MRKVPTLFERDPENRSRVLDVLNLSCGWVVEGGSSVRATRKYDGASMLRLGDEARASLSPADEGRMVPMWWSRREVKPGLEPPETYLVADLDPVTGKTFGWEPLRESSWHTWWAEATDGRPGRFPEGTYELVGPKINGNPERFTRHTLIAHRTPERLADGEALAPIERAMVLDGVPTEHDALREYLTGRDIEGVVWQHDDDRWCKIKLRDFGLRRPHPSGPVDSGLDRLREIDDEARARREGGA